MEWKKKNRQIYEKEIVESSHGVVGSIPTWNSENLSSIALTCCQATIELAFKLVVVLFCFFHFFYFANTHVMCLFFLVSFSGSHFMLKQL